MAARTDLQKSVDERVGSLEERIDRATEAMKAISEQLERNLVVSNEILSDLEA
jgi:hypothetical protein